MAIIRGHGSIAVGKIIEEAYVHICSLEHYCRVNYYYELMKRSGNTNIAIIPLSE